MWQPGAGAARASSASAGGRAAARARGMRGGRIAAAMPHTHKITHSLACAQRAGAPARSGGRRSARPASHSQVPPPPRHSPTRTQGSADHERSLNDTHAEAAGDLRLPEMQREAQEGACQKRAIGLHAASVRLHEAVQEHSESDSVLADMPAPGNVATDDQMEGRGRRRTPQKWRPGNWETETRQAHQERHQIPPS